MCDQEILNYAVDFDIFKPAINNDVPQTSQQHGLFFDKKPHGLPKRSKRIEMLARQIANADDLVQQVRKAIEERQLVNQRLQDFQQSAQDIKELYEQEKKLRIEFEQKYNTTHANYVQLEEAHTRKTLECENLKELIQQLRGTVEHNDLVLRYIKLAQELQEEGKLRRKDKELVSNLRQYCQDRNIIVPQYRKSRNIKLKIDVDVQCDLINEKLVKSKIDAWTQYISTVATRGTNTNDLICRRDFGQIFPPVPSANSIEKLDSMLKELLEYDVSSYISPVSPLAVLEDEIMPEIETKSIGTETINWLEMVETKSIATETINWPAMVETKSIATETTSWPEMVETKSIGTCTYVVDKKSIGTSTNMPELCNRETCTYLCNLERNIGYIPSVQSTIDAARQHHDVHDNAAESVLFNKLWGIFGCMVSALINNKQLTTSDTADISSVLPKTVFSSWYKAACDNSHDRLNSAINENLHKDTSSMSRDVSLSTSVEDDVVMQEEFSNSEEESNSRPSPCRERSSSESSSNESTSSSLSSIQPHISRRITRSLFSNISPKISKKQTISPLKAALTSCGTNRVNVNQTMPTHVKTQPTKYSARLRNKRIAAAGEKKVAEEINSNVDIGDNVRFIGQPKKRIAHQRNQMPDNNNVQQQINAGSPNCKRLKLDNNSEKEDVASKLINILPNAVNIPQMQNKLIDECCQANVDKCSEENIVEDVTANNNQLEVQENEKEIEMIKPKLFVKQNLMANKIDDNEISSREEEEEKEEAVPVDSSMSEDNDSLYKIEKNTGNDGEDGYSTDNDLMIDENSSPMEILELPESPCKMDLEPPKPPIVIPLDLDDKFKCKKQQTKRHNNFMTTLVKSTMRTKQRKIINYETKKSTYSSILKLNLQQYMNKEEAEEELKEQSAEKAVNKENATAFILKLVKENVDYGLLAKTIVSYTRETYPFGKQHDDSNQLNAVKRIWQLVNDLQIKYPKFCHIFTGEIERILFNAQRTEKLSVDELINLLKLNLLCENMAKNLKHAARLMIAKCLYYYNKMAMPMIYVILCEHPTALPHRENNSHDKNEPLLSVIQHLLMCNKYDMDNKELRHRELLSKLRFEYHYEPFQPDRNLVLNNLLTQLRTGTYLTQLSYAFALFCKRIHPHIVWNTVLNANLIPLANEWLQQATCAERIVVLLDCISQVVKPLPLQTDVSAFLTLFQRFLTSQNYTIREAAVRAILRLQRFGYVNCYNSLLTFQLGGKSTMQMQPTTLAMLRTFINRKPLCFWQEINPDEFL